MAVRCAAVVSLVVEPPVLWRWHDGMLPEVFQPTNYTGFIVVWMMILWLKNAVTA